MKKRTEVPDGHYLEGLTTPVFPHTNKACYGIVSVPSGLWFCRKCESQERAARVRCELCPKKEGALKRTDSGGWAHVVCALYIPEATFGNNRTMEPIITSKLPKEKFSKPCYICEEAGLETQATHGACMNCHKSSCRMAFHVTCGQKEHLLCEEPDQRDPNSLVYCGYCHNHYKKMVSQKVKQHGGRKQTLSERSINTSISSSTVPYPVPAAHTGSYPQLSFQLPISIRSISPPTPSYVHHPVTTSTQSSIPASTSTVVSTATSTSPLRIPGTTDSTVSQCTTAVTSNTVSHPPSQGQALQSSSHPNPPFSHPAPPPSTSLHLIPTLQPNVHSSSSQLSLVLPIQIPATFHSQSISQVVQSVSQSLLSVPQSLLPVSQSLPLAPQNIVPSQSAHALFQLALSQAIPHHLNKVTHKVQRAKKEDVALLPVSQKRVSANTPMPSAKRNCRRRKLSSSNESTTSETLSVTSDITQLPHIPPTSPTFSAVSSSAKLLRDDAPSHPTPQVDLSNGGQHIRPSSPNVTSTGASHHTSDSNNGGGRTLGPPMSLQELLERQWEQAAQFIIHQAGQQNNAGVMLAHLHQLQSENRRMQARIMELASQREFYIATNTRLHQTLTEHDLAGGNKLTNGIYILGEGSLRNQQVGHVNVPSTQISSVTGAQSVVDTHQSTKSIPFVVKSVPDPLIQSFDLQNGSASVETAVRKMAHGRPLLQHQWNTQTELEQLAVSTTNAPGGRTITLQGTPDVTHVTDSIQTPISTFAALPVGTTPQWCD